MEGPEITSAMKSACMGEFSVSKTLSCDFCDSSENLLDNGYIICPQCKGAKEYEFSIVVDWTTTKDIYKGMCKVKPSYWKPLLDFEERSKRFHTTP